ncbi:MAG: AAA family ATPase [Rhodothermia bacterium]
MIQIESIHIEEFRGIRNLTLTMNRGSFVISGPNGSGKSGVVDAIQFALTGEIARLKGAGTGELKLAEHGPHVDKRSYPDVSFVRLDVHIPHLDKSASITRKIKKPKHPSITPGDDDVKAVFAELAEHPEITLSRREIIKFILTEATQRSRDVQTLLKLDDIDQSRATLKTTENKRDTALAAARTLEDAAKESLKRHLDITVIKADELLAVVNQRRKVLGLTEIIELTKDTSVSQGISNKAVHYNEWADLSKEDFAPVVEAFKKLLLQFRCEKPNCDSWFSLSSRINPADLRCACGSFRLNLRTK